MKKKLTLAIASAALVAVGLTGCAKISEPFNDAKIAAKHDEPAEVYSMPDGYSNVASKCDGYGHRMFVVYHGDSAYGSVDVIDDPRCGK